VLAQALHEHDGMRRSRPSSLSVLSTTRQPLQALESYYLRNGPVGASCLHLFPAAPFQRESRARCRVHQSCLLPPGVRNSCSYAHAYGRSPNT
jgi:hypothetical protein